MEAEFGKVQLIKEKELSALCIGLIKLTEDVLASVTELIQDMLRLQLLLPDCFPFDAVLKIEPAQTGHSNLLVHKLAMEQYAALLQSDTGPDPQCLMTKKELNMLLFKPARLSISFGRRFAFESTTADMLHRTVWHRKCF